jgi:hypothetical protein
MKLIAILLLFSLKSFAFDAAEIDYRLGDKYIVHTIDEKTLKIVSGPTTVKRKLDKDDLKWIEERLSLLRSLAKDSCGDEATIVIKQKGREPFTVCGDQKDAKDFLSVLVVK